MPTAEQLRISAKDKGEYLISDDQNWDGARRGVEAVIVSIEKCRGTSRQWAVADRENMKEVFEMLGFQVKVMVDKSAADLKAGLKDISSTISSGLSDCFVCFVSAYGNISDDGRHFILDNEGNYVYVEEDIIEPFKTCKFLGGKPKVFIINSCTTDSVGEPSTISRKPTRRPREASKDLLTVFCTENENLDEPVSETRFIPALVALLNQNHNDKDVEEIIALANRSQGVSVRTSLDGKLYWKRRRPGGIILPPEPVGKRLLLIYRTPDQDPELDVVLFHGYEFGGRGLYPAALSSWFTASEKPVCWPVEWLPSELDGIPMRVFCIKYSESIDNPEQCSSELKLNELAEQVREDLTLATEPLIFIAHGLGGLLVQEVLHIEDECVQHLKKRLRGIAFYGVPYDLAAAAKTFSLSALENALRQENGYLSAVRKSEIEEAMNSKGAVLEARKNFCRKYKHITLSFEEGKETCGAKINLVAAQKYATEVNTIEKTCSTCNHFDVCRPKTLKDNTDIFTGLLRFIRKQLHNCDRTDIIVGQDIHRKKLKSWLLTREIRPASIAGITGGETFGVAGMGGIGKTTLANSLLKDEDIKSYYDHRVYWIALKKDPNIIDCQRRLLIEICKVPSMELDSEELLQEELKRKLSKLKRVLLFLDDVWQKDHVDRLLGDSFMKTFPPQSKCIITSRKPAELAKLDTGEQIEKLDILNEVDARRLFCSKAFLTGKMPKDDKLSVVVKEVIDACGNMPILLATIGAHRWGKRSIKSWEDVRDRLKNISTENITAESKSDEEHRSYNDLIKQVRISYDDLPVRDQESGEGFNLKDYFLDFAAFPKREEIEIAVLMDLWTKPGLTEDGAYRILEELEQRCLVRIVGYWCYVHDIFRTLAVNIIEEQPLKKRKRLFAWGLNNSRLPWEVSREARSDELFETETMVIARSDLMEIHSSDATLFTYLSHLRKLFLTSNLNLVSLPSAIKHMTSLEKLDLSWCLGLERLPREIGQLQSLEKLSLAGCCSLTEIPAEIGNLKKLLELNMQSCGIQKLPDEIGELERLTYLCLNDCNGLEILPAAMGKLSSLEKLECEVLQIREIPKALGDLSNLNYLSFGASVGISEIPAEFVKLKKLVCLWFVNAGNLRFVPNELDKLVTEGSLVIFNVYNTKVIWDDLPPNLKALPKPFDGTAQDSEVDATADNLDGPYWSRRRGMLVNTTSLYDPSNKEQRRLSFGLVGVVTLAKTEPPFSPRFDMAIRIMYTMSNYIQTRHAIVRSGGVPILLLCIDKGNPYGCGQYASATLANMCVTPSTHKAIVDAPHGLDILTRVLHRKNWVSDSAFQALLWIMAGDNLEKDWTYYSEIIDKFGHTYGHTGCACIWCQYYFKKFLKVKDVF